MQLLQKLLNKFNGLYFKQEFLCLDKSSFEQPLNVYIVSGYKIIKNITDHHLFTGYSPLVFALPHFNEIDLSKTQKLEIAFSDKQLFLNEPVIQKDAIAKIYFKKLRQLEIDGKPVYFYEGEKGVHKFMHGYHQQVLQLHNKLYNKRPANVYLHDNLLKQVQIAYSIPRKISLITIGIGNLYNLFPTDLHGQIDNSHYIISLRHGGKAAHQVERSKKVLISEIDPSFYKTVYSLGKNHMQELKPKGDLPFDENLSAALSLPLPKQTVYYRELELFTHFDHGIHRFFLFKILNRQQLKNNPAILAHIHNVYATWRHNKDLSGNYLLR